MEIPKLKDIYDTLKYLPKGQSIQVNFIGTQGVDGSQFNIKYDFNNKCEVITRIEEAESF